MKLRSNRIRLSDTFQRPTDDRVPTAKSKMFRRNPTRIELKIEDIQEYNSLKDELQEKSMDKISLKRQTPVKTKEERIGITSKRSAPSN